MKPIIAIPALAALVLSSCAAFDPEYAEYKKQKEAEAAGQAPLGGAADPYGAAAANPYGVPGQGGTDVGTYTPQPTAPYQPLPAVNPAAGNDPYAPNRPGGFPTIPGPGAGGATTPHVVAKGDSLWGLSKKYGVSQDAIRAANGLSGNTIVIGTTLQIPSN